LPMRVSRRSGLALLRQYEDWAAEKLAALPRLVRFTPGALIPVSGWRRFSRAATAWSGARQHTWNHACSASLRRC